jgi:neutral ceramidase
VKRIFHSTPASLILCLLLLGAQAPAAPARGDDSRVFRAGAATGDITPELGSMIIGGFSPTPAKHVHDPLQVRALVLDDGVERLAIVICDNIGLPREVCDEAKRLTRERSGLEPSRVLLAATHTHSGVTAGTETSIGPNNGRGPDDIAAYQRLIATRVADTIQRAINQLQPARIGWGRGAEPSQVFNRRWHVADEALRRNPFGGVDTVRMNPPAGSPALLEPAGPTDPEIPFLAVQTLDGHPLALLAAYSLHYVGGVPSGVVSADYFAVFCTRIAELLGADRPRDPRSAPFVALLANGTSGDINNVDFRARRAPQPPFAQMHRVANMVAAEVYRAYQTVEYKERVTLGARYEELTLRSRRPTPEMMTRARAVLARTGPGPEWHPRETSYARRVLQRAEAPETLLVPVQAIRIGDVAVMAVPAETFAETGLELKARAPFPHAFTISLANGYYGYMPSTRQLELGGYESWVGTNRLEAGAAPKITATLLRMLGEMKPPESAPGATK